MTQPQHASADLLADLLEGNVSAAEAMSVNAHVAGCAECADLRDALLDVSRVLAEEGAAPWQMPADLASSLDAALAAAGAERAGNVVSLGTARSRRRRPLTWLAGAAALVVVAGAGVAGWRAMAPEGGSSSSASAPNADSASVSPSDGAGNALTPSSRLPNIGNSTISNAISSVTAAGLPARARQLAAHPSHRVAPAAYQCADPLGDGISTVVLWQGKRAVLDVQPATRTATVLDCKTAVQSLYTTGY